MRVLVAEDERLLADTIADGLRRHAMAVDVTYDGDAALERLAVNDYDVLVLDRDLPIVAGDEVCTTVVDSGADTRILMLTAAGALPQRLAGLGLGADDYLTKPFAFDELLARIRARLRPRGDHGAVLRVGDLKLDTRTRKAIAAGREVDLSAREFALLETFMRHPGQVLSRAQLLSRVWGFDFDPGTNLVDVYVGYLRRKLGSGLLETVRGSGYRLMPGPFEP